MRVRRLVPAVVVLLVLTPLTQVASAGLRQGQAIDGPSPNILSLGGVALAFDATGGAVYLRTAGGVTHVFAATVRGGVWSPPVQIDGGVAAAASEPVIAASNGGRVAIAWVSGGTLYGAVRAAGSGGFTAPQAIAAASEGTSLSMGVSGTAYVSFTAPDGSGSDVLVARLDRHSTSFVPLSGALNASPQGMDGTGVPLHSHVTVSADATALVAWGENGTDARTHVLARRVFGMNESVVTFDLTAATLGADSPSVGIEFDSSYAWIAYRQSVAAAGGATQSRVLVRDLVGSQLGPPLEVDSLGSTSAGGAVEPAIALNGTGYGLTCSTLQPGSAVIGSTTASGQFGAGQQTNQGSDAADPHCVVALGSDDSGIVAWQSAAGAIVGRPYAAGAPGSGVLLSNAALGSVDATNGLSAASDATGDAIVGYAQGPPTSRSIAIAELLAPPGPFTDVTSGRIAAGRAVVLHWTKSRSVFGNPVSYSVLVDGRLAATTKVTRYTVTVSLAAGRHLWQAIAIDAAGEQRAGPVRTLVLAHAVRGHH